jgi:hypothetical protein
VKQLELQYKTATQQAEFYEKLMGQEDKKLDREKKLSEINRNNAEANMAGGLVGLNGAGPPGAAGVFDPAAIAAHIANKNGGAVEPATKEPPKEREKTWRDYPMGSDLYWKGKRAEEERLAKEKEGRVMDQEERLRRLREQGQLGSQR